MSRDRKAVAHPMVAADLEHPPVALGQRNILVELVPAETGHRSLSSAPHRIDAAQIEFDIEPCPRVGIIVDQKRGRPARTAAVVGQREMIEPRSEEHTSELQSLMRISYAVFCLQKKTK